MSGKLVIGPFYLRFDPTFIYKTEVLLGFNYTTGMYAMCKEKEMINCVTFDYGEFQIGFLVFTIAIGKEKIIEMTANEQ